MGIRSVTLYYDLCDTGVSTSIALNQKKIQMQYPMRSHRATAFIQQTANGILEKISDALLFETPFADECDKIFSAHARDYEKVTALLDEFYTDAYERYLSGGSLKTARHVLNTLRRFEEFEKTFSQRKLRTNEVTQEILDNWFLFLVRTRKVTHYSAVRVVIQLITLLNKVVHAGLLPPHALKAPRVSKPPIQPVYLNKSELKKFTAYIPPEKYHREMQLMFLIMCRTGLDYKGMLQCKKKDFDGKYLTVPRRYQSLKIPLCEQAIKYIQSFKLRSSLLFPQYSINAFNKHINFIARDAGIHKRISSRSGQLTLAFTLGMPSGMSIETISVLFNHYRVQYTTGKLPTTEYTNTLIMDIIQKNRAT